jgi:hypothetical protein
LSTGQIYKAGPFVILPPLLSIYLLLISGFAKTFIIKDIERFTANASGLKAKQKVIQNVALSWATQLGFFNSMFASILSMISIYFQSQNFALLALHRQVGPAPFNDLFRSPFKKLRVSADFARR